MNSDYGSMKNDPPVSATITFPASKVIASGASYSVTKDIVVGSKGAITKVFIEHPIASGYWSTSGMLHVIIPAVDPVGGSYYLEAYGVRLNATTVRLTVYVGNNLSPAHSLTTEATARDINFKVYTFVPPFA